MIARVLAVLACSCILANAVSANCRQALALGLDVSGSVDEREYRLQLDGVAGALSDPEVRAALFAMESAPVSLAVFEWSGPDHQRLLVPWTALTSDTVLAHVTAQLQATQRVPAEVSTAIGAAKRYGAAVLAQRPGCWRYVLDLSGDGESNTGPAPKSVRPEGVTINGLVIGATGDADGLGALGSYYRAYVIQGDDAFVETALGFEAFEEAMIRKLKREISVLVLGAN